MNSVSHRWLAGTTSLFFRWSNLSIKERYNLKMSYEEWLYELATELECTPPALTEEIPKLYYLWKSGISVQEAYEMIRFGYNT